MHMAMRLGVPALPDAGLQAAAVQSGYPRSSPLALRVAVRPPAGVLDETPEQAPQRQLAQVLHQRPRAHKAVVVHLQYMISCMCTCVHMHSVMYVSSWCAQASCPPRPVSGPLLRSNVHVPVRPPLPGPPTLSTWVTSGSAAAMRTISSVWWVMLS